MFIIETLSRLVRQLRNNQRGVTTVEYAIMLVLIAVTVATFGTGISDAVTGVFSKLVVALAS